MPSRPSKPARPTSIPACWALASAMASPRWAGWSRACTRSIRPGSQVQPAPAHATSTRWLPQLVGVDIPFNNYITGFSAFTHKAGIHAKAVLNNPSTYEVLNPEDFGLTRYIHIASRLTGWNAIRYRADQLGSESGRLQVKDVITEKVKLMADERPDHPG